MTSRLHVEDLYQRHSRRVWSLALSIVHDPALADDVSQNVWLRVIKHRNAFRGESRFSTWLHRITVNCALRAISVERRREERLALLPKEQARPDRWLCDRLFLEQLLEQLPEQMRQILILHAVNGFRHEEIAQQLDIVPGSSRSQLSRARAKVK